MPDELRLEVTGYTDLTRWRWVLTGADGAFLADHEVRLDPGAERFEAFTALRDYVDWHAAPDKRMAEERRIVTGLGDWIGTEVFGPAIGGALLNHSPATVQVVLPAGAEPLAYLPLEAARIQGRSLAAHDLTLVIRPPAADSSPAKTTRANSRLRVLGLFSLPEGGTALNLRRERQSLVQLIEKLAASGRAADVKALQYGVTRDKLRGILQDDEGWDVIHISGHGVPGELILETADGHPDRIPAPDLADLLDLARDRVRLVTVSACWSAALATAEPRRLLGLPAPEDQRHFPPERIAASPSSQLPAPGDIATTLATRLGCAVLAMRFPVGDEFAIELAEKLYALLADEGRPLPDAVAMTLKHLADRPAGEWFPALSMAAPAIFGTTAAGLALKAPPRTAPMSGAAQHPKMAGFPPQSARFVGRTGVMTRASAGLAPDSGIPGVLLHGMPGGGKTACALELAYTHEEAFDQLIWFKAPDEGTAINGSLTDFALTLERYLDGFQMIHVLADASKLTAFLPRLTDLLERNRLLIVIDNAESLLVNSGHWRDARWGQVVEAFTGHNGLARLILTTRHVSATLPVRGDDPPYPPRCPLLVESVDALTLDEGLLLARELPNLRKLIGTVTTRELAAHVLEKARGHPKLLELANGQASDPKRLAMLIESGDAPSSSDDYLRVLAAWTNAVTDTLSPGERDLFWFLCCLEEPDRIRPVLDSDWDDLWRRLGRDGNPPALDRALAALTARGLAAIREETSGKNEAYALHPGVAATGRDHAGPGFQDAVDTEVAAWWDAVHRHAAGKTGDGTVDTGLLVRAGLAAVPYLTRLQQWEAAAALLHNAFAHDPTPASAAAVLPAIEHITRHDPRRALTLATVLRVLDPAAAETQLRALIGDAAARGDYWAAHVAATDLALLCLDSGRLAEALDLTGQMAGYARQADLGPWTQLNDEIARLQVLSAMGQARQVLDDVRRLRDHMDTLPDSPGPDEAVSPWEVREGLLDANRHAALQLGQWQDALDLNAARIASMRDRRAPAADTARTRFGDYGPLLRLDRTGDALALLLDCRQAFHDARDTEMLGKTFTALADVEGKRGHGDAAIRLGRDALRYSYLAGDVIGIAVSYHNLGNSLRLNSVRLNVCQPAPILASHLTSALICTLTGAGDADDSILNAAIDLRIFGNDVEPPVVIADLCRTLGNIPGTNPAALIAKLSPDPETAERTLQDLIAMVLVVAREEE